MDEDYNMVYGIDKLAELLVERGIEFCVKDEASLFFIDASGNPHECWMAGAEENLVNVMIVVTPEQAVSVPDLNGVISENAKLRKLVKDMVLNIGGCALHGNPLRLREFGSRAKELGIEFRETYG